MSVPIWISSNIKGIAGHLLRLAPGINVQEFAPSEIGEFLEKNRENVSGILVADNPVFAPLLYKRGLPIHFIQSTWAGVDSILQHLEQGKDPDVTVCRFTNEKFSQLMSEYVISQVIGSERRFRKLDSLQASCTWANSDPEVTQHRSLDEIKVGILGLGKMGTSIAKTFKFFGTQVWGYARQSSYVDRPFVDVFCSDDTSTSTLKDLVCQCDYIVNTLPKTPKTDYLLSAEMLKTAKGSVFINVGRSNVIRESTILETLESGCLREAILDVFDTEPLPAGHPFWSHPKVLVTPHVSGISRSKDVAACCLANYNRFISGEPLADLVNWKEKY